MVSISPRRRVLRAKKFALLGLMVDASATKFAQRTKNAPKMAFYGMLGEFFRGNAGGGGVPGEFFRGNAGGGGVLGEFFRGNAGGGGVLGELCRGPAAAGSRWANLWCLDGGCAPPLDLGQAHTPRSRVDVALDVGLAPSPRSRVCLPLEARVGASLRPHATAFPQDSSRFVENATHPYI